MQKKEIKNSKEERNQWKQCILFGMIHEVTML